MTNADKLELKGGSFKVRARSISPPLIIPSLPEHCHYCFQVILSYLQKRSSTEDVAVPFDDQGSEYPLFVTWNIYPSPSRASRILSSAASVAMAAPSSPSASIFSSGSPRLRGCIGTFEPYPLVSGLSEYAIISAFKDRRFNPISEKELSRLECAVSLLTGFEDCDDYLDWEVGIHGIYIHLPNPALSPSKLFAEDASSSSSGSGSSTPAVSARRASSGRGPSGPAFLTATYLPDVIPDQGWTKVEAIDSAIRKAGWNGKITEDMRRGLRVRRYRSEKVTQTYEDFMRWKESNGIQ
ncbi:hypothetical protein IE53DRAFT_374294 [Violaceomyces palustris]|uniref:Uncharacterized protein n=1 Tax=Violaceomyces palustris TaxID=1673888 RepID=A0ACD0NYZ8_9BASI|nr:hypothetical protein IE53DRAFT_374294 [Violaceomyces palustris]